MGKSRTFTVVLTESQVRLILKAIGLWGVMRGTGGARRAVHRKLKQVLGEWEGQSDGD